MTYAVTEFISDKLHPKYTENRSIPFSQSFEETGPATPTFFILSPGVDPLKDVEALGRKLGFTFAKRNFHNVSLGQGQEVVAEQAMEQAAKEGHWVILQNVHFSLRKQLLRNKPLLFQGLKMTRVSQEETPECTPATSHPLPKHIPV